MKRELLIGQCAKCGGNLAQCYQMGCPRDPPKQPTREEALMLHRIMQDAVRRVKSTKKKATP